MQALLLFLSQANAIIFQFFKKKLSHVKSALKLVAQIKQFKITLIFFFFFFVALFITFSNSAHHTYSCIGTSGKIAKTPMRGFW